MRSIGTSTSSAVVGVVLTHMTQPLGTTVVPSLDGFRIAFVIAASAGVVALAIGAFIPGKAKGRTAVTAARPQAAGTKASEVDAEVLSDAPQT
jgi:hypothetical protein